MALRRKEKALTLEEIKEKVHQTTDEFWMHAEPLCGVTSLIDNGKLITLSPKVEKNILVIFLLDIADYTSDRALETIVAWQNIYPLLPWTPIVAFRSKYLFLKNQRFFETFRHVTNFATLPIFLDESGDWFRFYGAGKPKVIFSYEGNTVFEADLLPNYAEQIDLAERKLQENLRLHDKGLPLLEVVPSQKELLLDQSSTPSVDIARTGYWTQASEFSVATDDPNAKLTLPVSGTHLRLIAITHPQARENTKAQVFLDDQPLPASLHGHQVHPGDKGQSVLEINKHTGIYEILRADHKVQGIITIKFLNALENPVVIYELRSI